MAITYYLRDTTNSTCAVGGGVDDNLMSTTQGTTNTVAYNAAGLTSYTEVASFQVDVTSDNIQTGSQTYNLSISVNAIGNVNWRVRLRGVDTSGCTRTNSSAYQTYTDGVAETKTFSLSLDFTSSDEQLELSVEIQESSAHGGRTVTFDVNDANSWVQAPTVLVPTEPLYRTMQRLLERRARLSALDLDITYTESSGVELPLQLTRQRMLERRGRISALDVDVTYTPVFTQETYTVDTGGGGDYSSLQAFETDKQQDLVDGNKQITVFCTSSDGSSDTNCTFQGWNSSRTNYLKIQGIQDHGGTWNPNIYRMAGASGNFTIKSEFTDGPGHLWIDNIQASSHSSGVQTIDSGADTTGKWCRLTRSIVRNLTTNACIRTANSDTELEIENVVAYGGGYGLQTLGTGESGYVYNMTVYGASTQAFSITTGSLAARNNVAIACAAGFSANGWDRPNSSNNVTEDGTGPGEYSRTGRASFRTADSSFLSVDLHPDQGDPLLLGGADLRNAGVTQDVQGRQRPLNSKYTYIGAYQEPTRIANHEIFAATLSTVGGTEFELERLRRGLLERIARLTAIDLDITYSLKTGRISALDSDITYSLKTGRISALDSDITYSVKTGRVSALDLDLTYTTDASGVEFVLATTRSNLLKRVARLSAVDVDLTYSLKTGRVSALDADITYSLKTGRISALDADITYSTTESGIEFVLAATRAAMLRRVARLAAVDLDITYALKTGRVSAIDVDVTHSLKTGRITAVDLDVTHALKTGRITAVDLDITHALKTGRISAVDLDITHTLKTGRIVAIDADIVYILHRGRITALDIDLVYDITGAEVGDDNPVRVAGVRPARGLRPVRLVRREDFRRWNG